MLGGIDEAGRGPVFGPLVVAGVSGPDQESFRDLGVRDSKVLSPVHRRRLSQEIERVARRVESVIVPAEEIDRRRSDETLNEIEVSAFAWIARRLGATELFVDAADVNASRFGVEIMRHLRPETEVSKLVAEHKADARYPVVSAASIIAKVRRDEEVARMAAPLERELGQPFGSGYPSDPVTIAFLERYHLQNGRLPLGTRTSWETARTIVARSRTRPLDRFGPPFVTPGPGPTR